jgi:AcrR family transcriptional regulator
VAALSDKPRRRKRLTRAEQQAATRAELVTAAARVFAKRGFYEASVEQIADEAGYSHGAVYSNFASKDELFLAAYADYAALRAREVSQILDDDSVPWPQRARAVADHWIERSSRNRDLLLLSAEFSLYAARRREVNRRFGTRLAALRLTIARFLDQEIDRSGLELPFTADEVALIMRSLGIGMAMERLHDPSIPDELYGKFVEWLAERLATDGDTSSH